MTLRAQALRTLSHETQRQPIRDLKLHPQGSLTCTWLANGFVPFVGPIRYGVRGVQTLRRRRAGLSPAAHGNLSIAKLHK